MQLIVFFLQIATQMGYEINKKYLKNEEKEEEEEVVCA